jgi:hypothetical protein
MTDIFTKLYKFLKTLLLIFSIMRNQNIGSPILLAKDGSIIDGHTRFRIAKSLGYKKIKVVRLSEATEYIAIEEIKESY